MAKICLCLTGPTIEKNLQALDRYRSLVDLAELRVDFLDSQERFRIRSFPEQAGIPTILSVRRRHDGGRFDQGEGVRLVILAKGLAFAESDPRKNFAYVDIENDLQIPAIQEAARIFGTRVIRSRYCLDGTPTDLENVWQSVSSSPFEIPKLAVNTRSIHDTERLFRFFGSMDNEQERIVVGMGEYGLCTRVLCDLTGSMFGYASAMGSGLEPSAPGQIDPDTLRSVYCFGEAGPDWNLYGILGGIPVLGSLSPRIHSAGFSAAGIKARYLPFPADDLDSFMRLAELLEVRGFSITAPFKEKILPRLSRRSPEVDAIGACNTAVRTERGWDGYNTDAHGFRKAVLQFMGARDLKGIRACIVGAGGAARSVAYVLLELGAEACVINRGITRAKRLAETYGLPWAGMTERAVDIIERYNDLIIQTTSVGMEGGPPGDPLEWYQFTGKEALFETIYNPQETALLRRARESGCRVTNGRSMLMAQAAAQFSLFTGKEYPESASLS